MVPSAPWPGAALPVTQTSPNTRKPGSGHTPRRYRTLFEEVSGYYPLRLNRVMRFFRAAMKRIDELLPDWSDERVASFWRTDLYGRFAASFGDPDRDTLTLLDAYFSLAMAANTTGTQRLARTLKGLALLGSLLSGS